MSVDRTPEAPEPALRVGPGLNRTDRRKAGMRRSAGRGKARRALEHLVDEGMRLTAANDPHNHLTPPPRRGRS